MYFSSRLGWVFLSYSIKSIVKEECNYHNKTQLNPICNFFGAFIYYVMDKNIDIKISQFGKSIFNIFYDAYKLTFLKYKVTMIKDLVKSKYANKLSILIEPVTFCMIKDLANQNNEQNLTVCLGKQAIKSIST